MQAVEEYVEQDNGKFYFYAVNFIKKKLELDTVEVMKTIPKKNYYKESRLSKNLLSRTMLLFVQQNKKRC